MSNPDSFIEEVTEEVRRDRLYRLFRKYAWVGVLLVVVIVGGTAANEWMKLRAAANAQAFGDAILDAMDLGGGDARREGLAAIPTKGDQAELMALMLSADPADDRASALASLDKVIADPALNAVYHDLAVLRRAILAGTDTPLADRRTALQGIAAAGRPYRVLAQEQLAYLLMEEGKTAEAVAALTALTIDQEAPGSLRNRVAQVITTLGGMIDAAGTAEAAPSDG